MLCIPLGKAPKIPVQPLESLWPAANARNYRHMACWSSRLWKWLTAKTPVVGILHAFPDRMQSAAQVGEGKGRHCLWPTGWSLEPPPPPRCRGLLSQILTCTPSKERSYRTLTLNSIAVLCFLLPKSTSKFLSWFFSFLVLSFIGCSRLQMEHRKKQPTIPQISPSLFWLCQEKICLKHVLINAATTTNFPFFKK